MQKSADMSALTCKSGENAPRAIRSGKTARLRSSGDDITQRGGTRIAPRTNRTSSASK